jgi:carboxylesterase type B
MGVLWDLLERAACLTITALALLEGRAGATFNGSPTVLTEQGLIKGFSENDTNVFLGIPFAQSTAGENRWKAPQSLAQSATAAFDATSYGPTCAQAMSGNAIVAQGEDCLNLNVWHSGI